MGAGSTSKNSRNIFIGTGSLAGILKLFLLVWEHPNKIHLTSIETWRTLGFHKTLLYQIHRPLAFQIYPSSPKLSGLLDKHF